MRNLKSTIATAAILLTVSTYANANDTKLLQKQLKPWQPIEITTHSKSMLIVLPGKEITPEAYNPLVMTGVCPPAWGKNAAASYLKDVKEISIVNEYKTVGYTLEERHSSACKLTHQMHARLKNGKIVEKWHKKPAFWVPVR